jgi:tetratricopeptide (TPR) repeat protein
MGDLKQAVADFVNSVESHPNGARIIEIIQKIFTSGLKEVDQEIIAALKQLCNFNKSLLIDFWILRAAIFKEEGRENDSLQTFFEAVKWRPDDVSTWFRITDFYKDHKELVKASFFLVEAQKRLKGENTIIDEYNQVMQQLEINLNLPTGLNSHDTLELSKRDSSGKNSHVPQVSSFSSSKQSFSITPSIDPVWNHAEECYKEALKEKNPVYIQAFIHYAHSTIRELLGLDGNFKDGLDGKLTIYGLIQYKSFFLNLNRLRNKVIHDQFIPSLNEIQTIYKQISRLLSSARN